METPVSTRYAVHRIRLGTWDGAPDRPWPGEELTMPDGAVWFHPYDGRPPVMLQAPAR